ncbi:ABC transporter ATP-binding protein [Martelella soudanensis]|uniref:ABC transporter ATP-binding protein n=1 Tax=unclassified Martelella TaxID=2629616 RepID=UPI0015DE4E55|nr:MULTISPECIES: ABC transporter ATP-binding protein [unclassified Martelella]
MSDIHLDRIKKSYGKVEVLHGIDLALSSGEFVSLLGASGCGKTTLLRTVAGLEAVTAGHVVIDGQDVTQLPPERRDIAMMFQSYALLPHLSVYENIRFPLRMRRIGDREEQDARVKAALETVQLSHLADRYPRQLSGGQQQRVALARAIVSNPKVLLLDEPLSNLDARLREDMQVELIEIHRRLGLTTLFVTHDQEEALSLSDRVVLLNAGKVEQEGAPAEIYARPATEFVSGFIGSANVLKANSEGGGSAVLEDGQCLAVSPDVAAGPVSVVLRQEDLTVSVTGEGLKAKVRTRVYLGARNRYVLTLAGETIRLLTDNETVFEPGDEVALSIEPGRVRVLARQA